MPPAPSTDVTRSGRVARLRYRPAARGDLPECFELLPPCLGLDSELARALPGLWERLVDEPSMVTGVIEDMAAPAGKRIQGWGVTLILPQAMVESLQLDGAPRAFIARRIYAALHDGSFTPMDDRAIGLANASGGLTMMILHFSIRDLDVSEAYSHSVISAANDAFRACHDGYRLRAIYFEIGADNDVVAASSGFDRLRYADEADLATLPAARRPALYGLTRERAKSRLPGTPARNAFEHQPPMFGFSASQRRLLWFSLFDDSDEALLPLLDVSVHGLKKLWRGIYERIEDRMPEFFGDAGADVDGKRGPEKRRQVLAYVRQRPEELRPWGR